jgi:hypothetical protein
MKTCSTNPRLPNTTPSLKYRTRQRSTSACDNLPPSAKTCFTFSGAKPERALGTDH